MSYLYRRTLFPWRQDQWDTFQFGYRPAAIDVVHFLPGSVSPELSHLPTENNIYLIFSLNID